MAYACNRCGATRYRAALSNTPSKTDCGIYNVTLHRQRPLAPCLSRIRHEEKLQRDGSEWQSSGGLLRKKKNRKWKACGFTQHQRRQKQTAPISHTPLHIWGRTCQHAGSAPVALLWPTSPQPLLAFISFLLSSTKCAFSCFFLNIIQFDDSSHLFLKTEKNCNEKLTFFIVP